MKCFFSKKTTIVMFRNIAIDALFLKRLTLTPEILVSLFSSSPSDGGKNCTGKDYELIGCRLQVCITKFEGLLFIEKWKALHLRESLIKFFDCNLNRLKVTFVPRGTLSHFMCMGGELRRLYNLGN